MIKSFATVHALLYTYILSVIMCIYSAIFYAYSQNHCTRACMSLNSIAEILFDERRLANLVRSYVDCINLNCTSLEYTLYNSLTVAPSSGDTTDKIRFVCSQKASVWCRNSSGNNTGVRNEYSLFVELYRPIFGYRPLEQYFAGENQVGFIEHVFYVLHTHYSIDLNVNLSIPAFYRSKLQETIYKESKGSNILNSSVLA